MAIIIELKMSFKFFTNQGKLAQIKPLLQGEHKPDEAKTIEHKRDQAMVDN